jgi:predicted CoA-substrate-specific enzyme activase
MFCGVDIGARSIEVVLFDGENPAGSLVADTGTSPAENGEKAFDELLQGSGLKRSDIGYTVATGYGRNYFELADRSVSEIVCHARGVSFLYPSARSVVDIGGQDSKLIELGEGGKPLDFVMNDRCAAGTGRFIEMVGTLLGVPVQEMNDTVSAGEGRVEISSMCAVFAESEIVGLLQRGSSVSTILNGVFTAVARRTLAMAGRARMEPDLVFTGGVALNRGVVEALRRETDLEILTPPDPRITGALGAAIIASTQESRALV